MMFIQAQYLQDTRAIINRAEHDMVVSRQR